MNLWKKITTNKTPGTMPVSSLFWSKFKPGDLILEVGCGWGRIVYECLDRKLRVVGIDINQNEIFSLKQRLAKDKVTTKIAKIYKKNILETNFSDHTYNGIIMQGVLSALTKNDRLKCLKEVQRLLIANGYVHISEFELNESNPAFKDRYDQDYLITNEYGTLSIKDESGKEIYQSHNFSIEEISDLVNNSGLHNIEIVKDIFLSYHGHKKPGMMIIAQN